MKPLGIVFLLIISLTGWAQTGITINDITGLVNGVFNYTRNADTLKFYRTFYDPAYKQTIGDIFTLTLFDGGIDATLDERIVKAVPGNMLYYRFTRYRPGH